VVLQLIMRMEAMIAHAVDEAMVVSQALANRRHLPSNVKVRSTTPAGQDDEAFGGVRALIWGYARQICHGGIIWQFPWRYLQIQRIDPCA